MKLYFSIPYRAQWGEDVCIELTLFGTKGREVSHLLRMETRDGNLWKTEYRVLETTVRQFRYRYIICRGDEVVRREWARAPRLFDADAGREFLLDDFWMDTPPEPWLFDPDLNARSIQGNIHTPIFAQTIVMRLLVPTQAPNEVVALIGSQPPLGDWKPERALRLMQTSPCEWRLALSTTALQLPFEYKYVIVDAETGDLLRWENGDNRRVAASNTYAPPAKGEQVQKAPRTAGTLTTIVRNDGLFRVKSETELKSEIADDKTPDTDAAVDSQKEQPNAAAPLEAVIKLAEAAGIKAVSLETLRDVADVISLFPVA